MSSSVPLQSPNAHARSDGKLADHVCDLHRQYEHPACVVRAGTARVCCVSRAELDFAPCPRWPLQKAYGSQTPFTT